jgi:hypothetical protein
MGRNECVAKAGASSVWVYMIFAMFNQIALRVVLTLRLRLVQRFELDCGAAAKVVQKRK